MLLRKIGVADTEFTIDSAAGRVHMFVGCNANKGFGANQFSSALGGGNFAPASDLWRDPAKLAKYDILLFSCEGGNARRRSRLTWPTSRRTPIKAVSSSSIICTSIG